MLYLAYESNMNSEQMNSRCKNARKICKGYLQGYKLFFDGYSENRNGLVADIREDENGFVPYVLWEVDEEDELELDRSEGYPKHYDKKTIRINDNLEVIAYVMTDYKKNLKTE